MRRDYMSSFVQDDKGCWNYTGTVAANGYGKILQTTAHRWFYEAIVGPIPAGMQLDHLCLNKRCVNPAHLEPVTGEENQRRRFARMTHCKSGHPLAGDNLAIKAVRGYDFRVCVTCRRRVGRESSRRARASSP